MCVLCYNPGIVIGELTLVGGPLAAMAAQRLKRSFGVATHDDEPQSEPLRTHQSDSAATVAPTAAATNAVG